MNIEIAEYSAYLTLPGLGIDVVGQIKRTAQELLAGINVSVSPNHLDFDYSGRDTNRKVIQFLCRVAPLIGSAEGEVKCLLTMDNDETLFEFYTVQHFRLYKQDAKLIKMPPTEVFLEVPETNRLPISVA
jgi:hypothetical protein